MRACHRIRACFASAYTLHTPFALLAAHGPSLTVLCVLTLTRTRLHLWVTPGCRPMPRGGGDDTAQLWRAREQARRVCDAAAGCSERQAAAEAVQADAGRAACRHTLAGSGARAAASTRLCTLAARMCEAATRLSQRLWRTAGGSRADSPAGNSHVALSARDVRGAPPTWLPCPPVSQAAQGFEGGQPSARPRRVVLQQQKIYRRRGVESFKYLCRKFCEM